ncbi:MAG: MBL fold metallo-hydrolase [Nitrososphaeria archaeon]
MPTLINQIRRSRVESREAAIWWLGQNFFIIKMATGKILAVDPYLSRQDRFVYVHSKAPMKPEELEVDYIFCTHDHLDHTNPFTLPIVSKNHSYTIFAGPPESYRHLQSLGIEEKRLIRFEVGQSYSFGELYVTAYYSATPEEADTSHFGYIIESEGIKIYVMGDSFKTAVARPETILEPVRNATPDVAMLPIVGDIPDRKPVDALTWSMYLMPKIVIPSHYDCFADRTIDPQEFAKLFKDIPQVKPTIIPYMGCYIYRHQ